jgi:O-antigen ligase
LEIVALPAVDYELEKYLPHNSILGLMSSGGLLGYAAMTLLWVVGAFFAMRAYYAATSPIDRTAAIVSFGVVLVYLIQCWGDLGLGAPQGVFLVAAALAVAGKLAVATGAWSDKKGEPLAGVAAANAGTNRPR